MDLKIIYKELEKSGWNVAEMGDFYKSLIHEVADITEKQLTIPVVMQWVAIDKQEPPFDKKILTWNENEPDEPSRTDTFTAIEHNSKGKLYKWLENGYPTHWMHLPKPPCA